MIGSSEPGSRLVLIAEPLFLELMEQSQIVTGKTLRVEWTKPHIDAVTWYEPIVWDETARPDQLTLVETAG